MGLVALAVAACGPEVDSTSHNTGGGTATSGAETSSSSTCAELDEGPPGALWTTCRFLCEPHGEANGEQANWERETYAEQAKDPSNECFMLRFAFEECIADFTCEDLAAFHEDSQSSPCADEWAALEPRYQECTRPE